MGLVRVELESDMLDVVNLCKSSVCDRADIGALCRQIIELGASFSNFNLTFVPRDANIAAHRCAKQASSSRRRCLWINFIPSFLQDCIQFNCNSAE